jgi:30S ribosomal protein S31
LAIIIFFCIVKLLLQRESTTTRTSSGFVYILIKKLKKSRFSANSTILSTSIHLQAHADTGGSIMGKGDKKTKRGKIARGTYGKTRPRKKKTKKEKG